MLCLCSDLVPVNPPTLHDEHYLHTVFIEPFGICLRVCVCVYGRRGLFFLKYSHVCSVNSLSPCHAEVGGLTLRRQNKADPFLTPSLRYEGIVCGFIKGCHTVSLIRLRAPHQEGSQFPLLRGSVDTSPANSRLPWLLRGDVSMRNTCPAVPPFLICSA